MNKKILVVDPETKLRHAIRQRLESHQMSVIEAENGQDALKLARDDVPDLVLTELFLSDITGLNLCRRLGEAPDTATCPVVIMSSYADEMDRIISFELGVDDFVSKPFSMRELAARLRAILRRPAPTSPALAQSTQPPPHADFDLDMVGQHVVDATPRELQILAELIRAGGRVVSREDLLRRVWAPEATATARTVDAHIKSLRKKLGDSRDRIRTIRGLGYCYEAEG